MQTLAKTFCGVALATMWKLTDFQLGVNGECVVATKVFAKSAYAKHLRSNRRANKHGKRFFKS